MVTGERGSRPRVLVLGGGGMLGHALWRVFPEWCDCIVTVRGDAANYRRWGLPAAVRVIGGIDAVGEGIVEDVIRREKPDVVVNCIGIVKQAEAARDPAISIRVNALLPHRIAQACVTVGCRFIHVSTDCVFSGRQGMYAESDIPDPVDLYGRSKLLGEVDGPGCLTVRTSMIGHELGSSHGLLEWYLRNPAPLVKGYTRAIFSGFTTVALADVFKRIILGKLTLTGVWHVAAAPISKCELLQLIRSVYGRGPDVVADDAFVCDRSLDGRRFVDATGCVSPSWPDMIRAMRGGEMEEGGESNA